MNKTIYNIEIENILNIVKSRIDAHLKFKKEYNKQLAFDFSLFHFFKIGENKISEILAYFLDKNQNHGQGNIFLKEFVKLFYNKNFQVKQLMNKCELVITENRRLDIYIELENFTIAIENKIWADDQNNQLKDYSKYLENKTNGNYLLLYLNPYGVEPSTRSISEDLKDKLIKQNKLKIISYKHDIINLINKWLVVCEADKVNHFLKEFKKYLEIKFLGKNTLNMSKELRTIIYDNENEIQHLVKEYKMIELEIIDKVNELGEGLNKIIPNTNIDAKLSIQGPNNWLGHRYYKCGISKNGDEIWMQFISEDINLYFDSALKMADDKALIFEEILSELNFTKRIKIENDKDTPELITFFLDQIQNVTKCFDIYEKRTNC